MWVTLVQFNNTAVTDRRTDRGTRTSFHLCKYQQLTDHKQQNQNSHWHTHTHVRLYGQMKTLHINTSRVNSKGRGQSRSETPWLDFSAPNWVQTKLSCTPQNTTSLKQCSLVNKEYNVLLLVVIFQSFTRKNRKNFFIQKAQQQLWGQQAHQRWWLSFHAVTVFLSSEAAPPGAVTVSLHRHRSYSKFNHISLFSEGDHFKIENAMKLKK